MLIEIADRLYVTASAFRIVAGTPRPCSSHSCWRANAAIETHSASTAASSHHGSATVSADTTWRGSGSLPRSTTAAAIVATARISRRRQRHRRTGAAESGVPGSVT
jgi:hypothetical protein